MAKKSDLEAAYRRHVETIHQSDQTEKLGQYPAALGLAESSLVMWLDALAYQRKYAPDRPPPLGALDRVLRLAPPLFARNSLDALAATLGQMKRADKAAHPDLPDRLATARRQLTTAVRTWAVLNEAVGTTELPAALDEPVGPILSVWVTMGLVAQVKRSSQYTLVTDLRRWTKGKCPSCGRSRSAPTTEMIAPQTCRACGQEGEFVLLPDTPGGAV